MDKSKEHNVGLQRTRAREDNTRDERDLRARLSKRILSLRTQESQVEAHGAKICPCKRGFGRILAQLEEVVATRERVKSARTY